MPPEFIEVIPGCFTIQGEKPGIHTAIVAGIHGDEQAGVHVNYDLLDALGQQKESICGQVTLVLAGNVPAIRQCERYLEKDVNRLFTDRHIADVRKRAADGLPFLYEEGRASQIARAIDSADVIIDLHATSKPTPSGFVVCAKDQIHFEFAKLFRDTKYIILDPGTEGPLDQYAAKKGKIAFTYEASDKLDLDIAPTIFRNCRNILTHNGNAFLGQPAKQNDESVIPLELCGEITMHEPYSTPKDYQNFDVIEAGELIAITGGKEIIATEKTYIVFPVLSPRVGETVLELAREVDTDQLPKQLYPLSEDSPQLQ